MTDNTQVFHKLVADGFQTIVKNEDKAVFVVEVDGETLFTAYLAAFPEGTNPIFKTRTEHDCSLCRQFIRRAGNVVSVVNGTLHTVWDQAAQKAPYPGNVVATALRDIVLAAPISNLFRAGRSEASFGAEHSRSLDKVSGKVLTWNHFHTGEIPTDFRPASPDQVRGDYRTTVQVFERGLTELSPSAVDTVLSLIEANNLYRGEEHKPALLQFRAAQQAFQQKEGRARQTFLWTNAHGPASRFRNTVIGTLVQDLSEGRDVEQAVASFEAKVAPTNYKRPTPVITPGMIKQAMEAITTLGLESALERRFAKISDVAIGDVKWVDGSVKNLMKGGIGDVLMQHAAVANPKRAEDEEKHAEEISLDAFMTSVLPEAASMELLFRSEQVGNLMSLTAPVHPEPRQLFRWNNDFAWSYSGNIADSIKERVKKAGGRVEGAALRVSLSWFNFDDLDLHIYEPHGRGLVGAYGDHIFFGARRGWTGGVLDVDMNVSPTTREPVENVAWPVVMPSGAYKVVVNSYTHRETNNPGFVIEVENAGKLSHFSYNKAVRGKTDVHVCTLHMKEGRIERVEAGDPSITAANISQERWGLITEQYVKVNAVVLSPNYWGANAVGNKHTFFIVDGARNDEPCRGIYNEFLHPRLEAHRKVFEVIGEKTKCPPAEEQLSGLGFSSTKHDSVLVRVKQGKKQRLFNIKIGA